MGPDYLFATPSFLSGASRALDLAGQFDEYNESPTPAAADARAAWLDWEAVGHELWLAMSAWRDDEASEADVS